MSLYVFHKSQGALQRDLPLPRNRTRRKPGSRRSVGPFLLFLKAEARTLCELPVLEEVATVLLYTSSSSLPFPVFASFFFYVFAHAFALFTDGVHKLKEQENPHLIAGLVVWHLKRQPEPLVPYSLYSLVVAAGAGAAAAAEAAALRLRHGSEQSQEDDREEGEDDLDEEDEEADRGGGRGLGGEGGTGGGVAHANGMGKAEEEGSGLGSGVMGPRGAGDEAAKKAEDGGVDENGSPKAAEGEAAAGGTVTRTTAGNKASETMTGSSEKTTDGTNALVATDAASPTTLTLNNSAKPTSPNSAKPTSPTYPLSTEADTKMTSKLEKHTRDSMPPESLWYQPGTAGVEWGVKGVAGAGADGNAEAGAGAGGDGGVGAKGGGGVEWDAVDGTVGLRHLQNLAAQLPYGAWQVLCLLLEFLAQVAALSKVNEMTSEALAQVRAFREFIRSRGGTCDGAIVQEWSC